MSFFSSRGPSIDGGIKPDISAPGSNILSSFNGNNSDYEVLSGTSMSCPHVAGSVAVLLSAKPTLTFDEISQLLFTGAEKKLPHYINTCGNISDNVFQNNYFGWGSLDLFQSLKMLLNHHRHV